jgi:hypothetical protein
MSDKSDDKTTGRMQVRVGPPGWAGRGEIPTVVAEFSSDHTWSASGYFNENGFPDPACHSFVRAAADQLALLHYSCDLVAQEVASDPEPFLRSLSKIDIDHIRSFEKHTIVYRNMSYHAGLSAALLSLKSGLDVYAKLMSKLIEPNRKPIDGFNRTSVDGIDVRGGYVLKWLAKLPTFAQHKLLHDAIASHIRAWINEAIKFRDDAVHFGNVPGAIGSYLKLTKPAAQVSQDDIEPPRMPNGLRVDVYCSSLYSRYCTFLRDTMPLLPGLVVAVLPGLGSNEKTSGSP